MQTVAFLGHIRYMTACERGGILPTPLDFITGGSSTLDAANWALADCHSAPAGRRKMLGVAAGKQGFDGDFGCFQLISPIKREIYGNLWKTTANMWQLLEWKWMNMTNRWIEGWIKLPMKYHIWRTEHPWIPAILMQLRRAAGFWSITSFFWIYRQNSFFFLK